MLSVWLGPCWLPNFRATSNAVRVWTAVAAPKCHFSSIFFQVAEGWCWLRKVAPGRKGLSEEHGPFLLLLGLLTFSSTSPPSLPSRPRVDRGLDRLFQERPFPNSKAEPKKPCLTFKQPEMVGPIPTVGLYITTTPPSGRLTFASGFDLVPFLNTPCRYSHPKPMKSNLHLAGSSSQARTQSNPSNVVQVPRTCAPLLSKHDQ